MSLCVFASISAVDCAASQRDVTVSHHPLDIGSRHCTVFLTHDTASYQLAPRRVSSGCRAQLFAEMQKGLTPLRAQCCGRESM